jgi:uncharacterized membrane protein
MSLFLQKNKFVFACQKITIHGLYIACDLLIYAVVVRMRPLYGSVQVT